MESIFVRKLLEAAGSNAGRTAIVDRGGLRRTAYGEFIDLARRTVTYLQSQDIAPGSFITVRMPYCMEYMAAELGIWLSRCIAVPLGDSFPQSRVDYIVEHCGSPLMLTLDLIDKVRILNPVEGVIPDSGDRAFLLYTSGSTGNPKGALIGFETMDNGVPRPLAPDVPMENVVFGCSAPLYFAFGNIVWNVLHAGGILHMYGDEVKNDVALMENYILEQGITISQISPAVLTMFRNRSPKLTTVITSGEKLTTQYSRDGYVLYNLYGQTETMHPTICYRMPDHPLEVIPIGKCMLGIDFKVVDTEDNPMPQGQVGEMCLRGPLFREYFREPELTGAAFRDGWLHTRDLVYTDDNGDIVYVNRKDWMVKVNGQRVEPGEVEAAIRCMDGVTGAIVKGFDGKGGSQYLCAFYTSDRDLDGETIREGLAASLPSYMVPSYYVKMDSFPLNANGKLDRKGLQAPPAESFRQEYTAPADDIETVLCDAFAKVLNLDRAGLNDDFFLLGGTSIQLMKIQQICAASGNAFFKAMSTKLISRGRTPKGIAQLLAVETVHEKRQLDDYPLNSIQTSYYNTCMAKAGQPVFNVSNLIKLDDGVDLERLSSAIAAAVAAHPGLQARLFVNEGGEPRQKYVPEEVKIEVEQLADKDFETLKMQLIQPFFLLGDRLFRFRIFKTASAAYLFYDIHHIIFDGTSQTILFGDIEKAYQGLSIEAENWNSYEMIAEEARFHNAGALEKAREWYRDNYGDAPQVERPDSNPDSSPKLTDKSFKLDVPYADVERFCNEYGTTVNVLTTSAFALLLGRYSCKNDLLFTSAYNGRDDMRIVNTVGLFARTLFLRSRWKAGESVRDFLDDMRVTILESMDNIIFRNELLRIYIPQTPGYHFIYQGDITDEPLIGGKPTEAVRISEKQAVSAIECHMFLDRKRQSFNLKVLYKKDCFSAAFIDKAVENFRFVLEGLMAKKRLSEINIDVNPESL